MRPLTYPHPPKSTLDQTQYNTAYPLPFLHSFVYETPWLPASNASELYTASTFILNFRFLYFHHTNPQLSGFYPSSFLEKLSILEQEKFHILNLLKALSILHSPFKEINLDDITTTPKKIISGPFSLTLTQVQTPYTPPAYDIAINAELMHYVALSYLQIFKHAWSTPPAAKPYQPPELSFKSCLRPSPPLMQYIRAIGILLPDFASISLLNLPHRHNTGVTFEASVVQSTYGHKHYRNYTLTVRKENDQHHLSLSHSLTQLIDQLSHTLFTHSNHSIQQTISSGSHIITQR